MTEHHEEVKLPAFFKDEKGEVFLALISEKYILRVWQYEQLASITHRSNMESLDGFVQCDRLEFAAAYGMAESKLNAAFNQLEEAAK